MDRSVSCSSTTAPSGSLVEIQSIMRIRPLSKKERDDYQVLEHVTSVRSRDPPTVVLLPFQKNLVSPPPHAGSSGRLRADSDTTATSFPREYHFNHILPTEATQDKSYHTVGLPMVNRIMDSLKRPSKLGSKPELLVCMGVAGSGKTHTCFGTYPVPKRRTPNDGLVTRIIEGMISQSKHILSGNLRNFAVGVTVVQIAQGKSGDPRACQVQDLLATSQLSTNKSTDPSPSKVLSPVPKKRLASVRSMVASFERTVLPTTIRSPVRSSSCDVVEVDVECPDPTVVKCKEGTFARETLQNALSAGRRAAKGFQSVHTLVTLEPFLNGKPSGEKISILDMAGIEKEKRSPSRGKDCVASGNQAASAAVLHCLRTLLHNTNVHYGNVDSLDIECVDDAASEISCVSQEKDPFKTRIKTVPFRQHKLTMMLSHLFHQSGTTSVTLFLAAYPGHIDYHEKKLLLQDLETLCGSLLLKRPSAANTGLEEGGEQGSVLSAETSSYGYSSALSYDDDDDDGGGEVQLGLSTDGIISRTKSTSSGEIHEQRENIGKVVLPQSFTSIPPEPTLIPTAPPDISVPVIAAIEPVAPLPPPKNPSFVSDFPGVAMPATKIQAEPRHTTTVVASAIAGGLNVRAPPSPKEKIEKIGPKVLEGVCRKPTVITSSMVGGPYSVPPPSPKDLVTRPVKEVSQEGSDSRSDSFAPETLRRLKRVQGQTSGPSVSKESRLIRHERDIQRTGQHSEKRGKNAIDQTSTDIQQKLKSLEAKVKKLSEQKSKLASKCDKLEKENYRLKKETVRLEKMRASRTEENEGPISKAAQELVQSPLWEHVRNVNVTYGIKNQWCMTQKPHFALRYPGHFKRAPVLDTRDRSESTGVVEESSLRVDVADLKKPCLHVGGSKRMSLSENMKVLRRALHSSSRPSFA